VQTCSRSPAGLAVISTAGRPASLQKLMGETLRLVAEVEIDGWGAFGSFVSSTILFYYNGDTLWLPSCMQDAPCVLLSLIYRFGNKVFLCNLAHCFGRKVSRISTFFFLFFSETKLTTAYITIPNCLIRAGYATQAMSPTCVGGK
jgi:hypothetical protein